MGDVETLDQTLFICAFCGKFSFCTAACDPTRARARARRGTFNVRFLYMTLLYLISYTSEIIGSITSGRPPLRPESQARPVSTKIGYITEPVTAHMRIYFQRQSEGVFDALVMIFPHTSNRGFVSETSNMHAVSHGGARLNNIIDRRPQYMRLGVKFYQHSELSLPTP